MTDVEEFFAKQMKDPAFKREYDALQEEFSKAEAETFGNTEGERPGLSEEARRRMDEAPEKFEKETAAEV